MTSIREATDLTKRQVEYRISPGERGLETWGPNGLLLCYDAGLTQTGGYAPRSAELTELGRQVVAVTRGEESVGTVDPQRSRSPATAEEIESLRESVEALEQQVAEIAPLAEQWADRDWGAVNKDQAAKVEGMFKTVVQLIQTFDALGLDRQMYADDAAFDSETQTVARQRVAEAMIETAMDEGLLDGGAPVEGSAGTPGEAGVESAKAAAPNDEGGLPTGEAMLEADAENEPEAAAGEDGDTDARGLDEFGDE